MIVVDTQPAVIIERDHRSGAVLDFSPITEVAPEPVFGVHYRRIRMAAGLRSPKKRRSKKHRQRREWYAQEGMLIQVDGSKHDWLEGRGPWLTLMLGIDDATGELVGGVFRGQEDA